MSELEAGRELDAKMAALMGWIDDGDLGSPVWCFRRTHENTPRVSDDWLERFPFETTGWFIRTADWPVGEWDRDTNPDPLGLGWRGVWSPSTDWRAAGVVVEKLRKNPFGFWMASYSDGGWVASLGCQEGSDASTGPLAICLAALRVVGDG